jgi:glycosyltransferase involved in cell wall biosynthesis
MTQAVVSITTPTRVALLSGACVRYDAISYSLRLKLDLLRSLKEAGARVEVRVFVQGTDLDDPEIRVRSLHELLLDPELTGSDVVVYEYGIAYELFDSLFALGPSQRSIGVYHNITPLELVQMPEERERVQHGLLLRHNLGLLDHVACDSEFNRLDLVSSGLPEERLSVLSLPPQASLPSIHGPNWSVEPVEILFVGRLVRAKGIHDLLDAIELLTSEGERGFRLALAGTTRWSEPETIEAVKTAVAAHEPVSMRIVADPDDETLERLYRASSILVIPSYHEGYCLPVLEAFHARCQVIAYDAGNLPTIVAGLGQLVETGDVRGLARAMRRAILAVREARNGGKSHGIPVTHGDVDPTEWAAAVAEHVERHSHEGYVREFLAILDSLGVDLRAETFSDATV